MPAFLPYGHQTIEDDDIAEVVRVLQSDWLTAGPDIAAFEADVARVGGASHAIALNSGTAALHLAFLALGVGPGSSVVVPANTFLATANAAILCGAEVRFCDVDPETGLTDAPRMEAALAGTDLPPAKALAPVHYAGQAVPMAAIGGLAAARGLAVVEDAAHAIGTRVEGDDGTWHPVGDCAHSAATIFSFHPVKTVTMGEGGALLTNDADLAHRVEVLRSHGMVREPGAFADRAGAFDGEAPNPWYYEMQQVGLNYRASGLQCALGAAQLRKLDRFVARRAELVARYDGLIAPMAPRLRPIGRVAGCRPGWHLYPLRVDFAAIGKSRRQVMEALAEQGIGSQVHYIPVCDQPFYRQRYGRQDLPGARAHYAQTLSLPLFPAMADSDVDRVVETLARIVG